MKSLRKTAILNCALLVPATLLFLVAQVLRGSAQQPKQQPQADPQTVPRQPSPAPQNDAQARITVNSNLVVLPVTVKDAAGNLVADLHRDEFRVFEDDVEQNIDVFSAEAFPLSMVILIDNDLKDKDAAPVRASLDAIVAGLSLDDEAWVCRFDQFFHQGKGFTSDQDKLLTELKRTNLDTEPSVAPPGGPFSGPSINNHSPNDPSSTDKSTQIIKGQPTKALDDAVYAAAQLLHDRSRARRKVIVLISDGLDGGKKFNTFGYDQVIKTLLRDNISLYSVAVPSAYLDRKLSPVDRTVSRLIRYANDSGGEVYHATTERSFEDFYSRLAEQARHQYTLAYVPRGTNRNLEVHKIEVRLKREGLTIKTRDRYYTAELPSR